MPVALEGALIGAAVALLLVASEYLMLRKAVDDRAKRLHRKAEFDETDRKRINTMLRFSIFVPPAFALFFWLIWG